MRRQSLQPYLEAITVVIVLLAALGVFFHLQILNGWTILFGDRTDGAIEVTILEHWFNTFKGVSEWGTTNYFYPYSGTLGYNDGYFLYGLIYSGFRASGVDPFLSSEFVNVAVKAVGFLGFYQALRSIFSLSVKMSLLGALIFTISNNSFVQAIHAQLFSIAFSPILALLLFRVYLLWYARRFVKAMCWGIAAAVWYGAWLLTAFYTVWFFTFFSFITIVVYCIAHPSQLLVFWRNRLSFVIPLIVWAVVLGIGLFPFALVYLPKAAETGMHPFAEALTFSPSIFDTVNVGPDNWLFGKLSVWLNATFRPDMPLGGERTSGLPPILIMSFICATVWLWNVRASGVTWLARAISAAAACSWLISLHWGPFTAWQWIYMYVPGAAAVRVIARYQIFLVAPVVAVVMVWLDHLSSKLGRPPFLLLALLLITEEINVGWPIGLTPRIELARLEAVPLMPRGCVAFAVTEVRPGPLAASPEVDAIYSHNVDAMLIAEYQNVPTVNGMASFVPPGWDFGEPARADYLSRISAYVAKHKIPDLCLLNLRTRTWSFLNEVVPEIRTGR